MLLTIMVINVRKSEVVVAFCNVISSRGVSWSEKRGLKAGAMGFLLIGSVHHLKEENNIGKFLNYPFRKVVAKQDRTCVRLWNC